MTKQEARRVHAWLHSIRRTERALENLRVALDDLETRYASPPTWMRSLKEVTVTESAVDTSKQEAWAAFLEEYPARKSFLQDVIRQHERKLEAWRDTLEDLRREDPLAAAVVKDVFYFRIRPYEAVWRREAVSNTTFYRALNFGMKFFFETLPHLFAWENREKIVKKS